MHSAYMIGSFWTNIPGYKTRGQCSRCLTTESMEHILIGCTAEPVNTIWPLARAKWPHSPELWPDINLGTILGCGSLTIPKNNNDNNNCNQNEGRTNNRGKNRLLQIMISESAHLIWVLRCNRVINDRSHTVTEIRSRWIKAINTRLTEDKVIATKIKRDKTSIRLVRQTWEDILKKDTNTPLPHDWVHNRVVLVGRRARHAP
jgi:hypothetical protein